MNKTKMRTVHYTFSISKPRLMYFLGPNRIHRKKTMFYTNAYYKRDLVFETKLVNFGGDNKLLVTSWLEKQNLFRERVSFVHDK